MMKRIELSRGKFATVDDCDFESLSKHKWNYLSLGYASRSVWNGKTKKKKIILMHRQIMGVKKAKDQVDHIDHDRLNNARANLRIVSNSQNMMNMATIRKHSSKYRGVHFDRRRGFFKVEITKNYKNIFIGYFDNEVDGAKAYNEKAKLYFGEFANLNKVPT